MRNWMKWAAVAAVGLVTVPVMGLSMIPAKTTSKTPARPAAKVTHVSTSSTKKTTMVAKPVVKNMSPRPASVRLGKNAPVKNLKTSMKSKPVMVTKTPVRPTTLHGGPAKLPMPKSTLSKAMERTHTPSSQMKSSVKSKPTNVMAKTEMN